MKKIIVLGAGNYQASLIKKAKELNFYVISVDNNPENIGHRYSHKSYNCSTLDKKQVLSIAKKENIDAIITHASDIAIETIGYVNDILNLTGISCLQAQCLTKKEKFRLLQKKLKLFHPDYCIISDINTTIRTYDTLKRKKYILKPSDRSGSLGITTLDLSQIEQKEFMTLANEAIHLSLSKIAIVEEYISGDAFSAEGFFINNELRIFVTQKQHYNSSLIPLSHIFPNPHSSEIIPLLKQQLLAIFGDLNISRCVFDLDGVFTKNKEVFIIELSPRTGGNYIPEIIKRSTNIDLISISLQIALGNKVEVNLEEKISYYTGIKLLVSEKSGVLQRAKVMLSNIQMFDEIEYETILEKQEGDSVKAFQDGSKKIGYILCQNKDIKQIEHLFSNIGLETFYEVDYANI